MIIIIIIIIISTLMCTYVRNELAVGRFTLDIHQVVLPAQ